MSEGDEGENEEKSVLLSMSISSPSAATTLFIERPSYAGTNGGDSAVTNNVLLRAPTPVEQIPTVRSAHPNFYDVEDDYCKWIEPEIFQVAYTGRWADYRETVPHPDFSDGKEAGIFISIEIRWQTRLYLHGIAQIPYAHAHDEQISRLVEIPNPKQHESWMRVYQQMKAEALEWISYVRVPLYHALLLHAEDRKVLGEIARLEYMKHSPNSGYTGMPITAHAIAQKCRWFTSAPPYSRWRDAEAMSSLLQTLVARGFLVWQGEEYAISGRINWEQRARLPKWGEEPEALVLMHVDDLASYAAAFGIEQGGQLADCWKEAILAHPGPVFMVHRQGDEAACVSAECAAIIALAYQRPQVAVLTWDDLITASGSWCKAIDYLGVLLRCLGGARVRLGGIWIGGEQDSSGSAVETQDALASRGFPAQVDPGLCRIHQHMNNAAS